MTDDSDSDTHELLPVFRHSRSSGSGCPNPLCPANDTYLKVLSIAELERVYPRQSDLDITPIPPQATHVCERCGFVFAGVRVSGFTDPTTDDYTDVDITRFDFDPERAYETDIRTAADELIAGAPSDCSREIVRAAVRQYIPGIGDDDVYDIIESHDREFDVPETGSMADFM